MHNADSKKATFYVPGMACSHCKQAISEALGESSGVTRADVDLLSKTVTVEYDPGRASLDRIKNILAEAGYPPQGGSEA